MLLRSGLLALRMLSGSGPLLLHGPLRGGSLVFGGRLGVLSRGLSFGSRLGVLSGSLSFGSRLPLSMLHGGRVLLLGHWFLLSRCRLSPLGCGWRVRCGMIFTRLECRFAGASSVRRGLPHGYGSRRPDVVVCR